MEQSEGPHGPTATASARGELIEPRAGSPYRERWNDVLDALEIMGDRGWRMISGPNWTIEFNADGEIVISVQPMRKDIRS